MTLEERIEQFKVLLGDEDVDNSEATTYLNLAKDTILTHRYPFGTAEVDVEPRFQSQQIQLAVVLYNRKGGEGEKSHKENGVEDNFQSVEEILKSIPRMVGLPK